MVRESLARIPRHAFPSDVTVRWYQEGDEAHWVRIHALADRYHASTPALYRREFGRDVGRLRERQCFLVDRGGEVLGTATAWTDDGSHGPAYGRVHWVAIVPRMQGRGLAKPLLRTVLVRMRELGHRAAFLTTESARLPAIHLYLRFGFEPELHSDRDRRVWDEIREQLKGRP